jgi:hypothetical protein
MSIEPVLDNHLDRGPGLPPVQAPTGKFIVQLFLVPLLIVTVLLLLYLGLNWLVGSEAVPDKLVERLESPNAEVRWRAADELAQRLKRDDRLASNPQLALRLTGLLRKAADDLEQTSRGSSAAGGSAVRKDLLEKRKDVEFLGPCVGALLIPTGIPVLTDLAVNGKGGDAKTVTLLRRQAVWSLANLGENVRRFRKLPLEQAEAVRQQLQAASAGSGGPAAWARAAYECLEDPSAKTGVVPALAECARADDPYLRTLVALALTFWEGDGEEKALAEKTLVTLSYDDGHGARVEIGDAD